MHLRITLLICFLLVGLGTGYQARRAWVRRLYPKGFEVSIPHEQGITLFAFHGKLNEKMNGLEAGRWSKDITQREGGRWVFRETQTALRRGDVIYFWTYVLKNGLGYRQDNGVFYVW
ncbi:uncharacterized protein Dwil_GK26785 [Drosophila willistoni]|uniref:CBM39 domain-containing protein n=1 Tax=Drosophila willistoni TaxID=7260 RepID=A0A0Q9WZJ0_DROWI|nr:uncharacterized protein Dwil_GK26785 [Drosophila willistoni]